jgi:hypothetical protein
MDAWRKTGDINALWPDVDPAARLAAHHLLAAATRAALNRSASVPRLRSDHLVSPRAIGIVAYTAGMGPLLGHWIEQGTVAADPPLAELFREHLEHGRARAARLATAFARVASACEAKGVALAVLKGLHTSRVYFPEAGTRPCADVDLLVRPDDFDRAREALRAAGFTEARWTSRPPRSEWVELGRPPALHSLELDHAENPWSIDLHQSLDRWYFRGLRAGFEPAVWRTEPLELEGYGVRALAQPLLTAFLAMHATHGVRVLRLIQVVELALVLRRDVASGTLKWKDLAALLAATHTARFVYPGLELVERLVPGTVDPELRADLARTGTARMRRVIDAIDGSGMRLPRRTLDEQLMWACGIRQLVYNIGEVLWPSDQALSALEIVRLYVRRAHLLIRGQVGLRSFVR